MSSILVTGGAGFIGSCFVRQQVTNSDYRVINIDKLTYAGSRSSLASVEDNPDYDFILADINDRAAVSEALDLHEPHAIVHFAAESHVDRSIDSPAEFMRTNVLGTFNLLECAQEFWSSRTPAEKEAFRFVHVSTDEVYGSLGPTGQFTETSPYQPRSPYAASKASADHIARAFCHTYGLPVIVTNCSNNYGPFQFPEKLVPLMILNAIEGRPLPVYGDGSNVRDWLYAEDHCRSIHRVLVSGVPGSTYNIGGNCERTNLEVVRTVCATVDRLLPKLSHAPCASLIEFVEDRPGHDWRYAMDATKIRGELGWQPQVEFESGMELTVQWYIDNRNWVDGVAAGARERRGVRLN